MELIDKNVPVISCEINKNNAYLVNMQIQKPCCLIFGTISEYEAASNIDVVQRMPSSDWSSMDGDMYWLSNQIQV